LHGKNQTKNRILDEKLTEKGGTVTTLHICQDADRLFTYAQLNVGQLY